jgi:hypothetical protein
MNTNSEVERIVHDWLEVRVVDPPHGSLELALARTEDVSQQRHWWQWWRGYPRGAGSDRNRLVFGAAAIATSVALIALVIALGLRQASVEPVLPVDPASEVEAILPVEPETVVRPGPDGTTWSVAAEGGDFATIGAAVAAAADGDTILIEPGTYEESVIIDKDITLRGNAVPPREVVLVVPAEAYEPLVPIEPFDRLVPSFALPEPLPVGIQLIETDATVQDLVVIGPGDGIAVLVHGGAPTLEGLTLKHQGAPIPQLHLTASLFVGGGSHASVRDTELWYRVRVSGGSAPTFSQSDFRFAYLVVQDGSTPVISDSTISGDCSCSDAIVVGGSLAVFRDDVFTGSGLDIVGRDGDGTAALVEGNRFSTHTMDALSVMDSATATISGNAFYGNQQGVRVAHASADVRDNDFVNNWNSVLLLDADASLVDNTIRGGTLGVSVTGAGSPHISGNVVENATHRGIFAADGTSPEIDHNRICGSVFNLLIEPEADPIVGDNEVCPDATEPPS